jgi:DNA replication protein DnaC
VLVVDEVGCLPFDQSSANWVFQVVSRRDEKPSPIALTSNRGFADWGQVFADQIVATDIVDRLIDNVIIINIRGRSHRMRAHQNVPATVTDLACLNSPRPGEIS